MQHGKEITWGIRHCMTGLRDDLVNRIHVRIAKSQIYMETKFIGLIKAVSTCVGFLTGYDYV